MSTQPLDPNDIPDDIQEIIHEEDDLHDPQKTPPSLHDEEYEEGIENDDDIDERGKEGGIHYEPDEELDISKKIPVTTPIEPPEEIEEEQG